MSSRESPNIAQSQLPFNVVTNRSRPELKLRKKIPMHVADVAGVVPDNNSDLLRSSSSSGLLSDHSVDRLGARNVRRHRHGQKNDKDIQYDNSRVLQIAEGV